MTSKYHTVHSPSTFHQSLSIKGPFSNIKHCCYANIHNIHDIQCTYVRVHVHVFYFEALAAFRHSTHLYHDSIFSLYSSAACSSNVNISVRMVRIKLFYSMDRYYKSFDERLEKKIRTQSLNAYQEWSGVEKLSVKFTWYNFVRIP